MATIKLLLIGGKKIFKLEGSAPNPRDYITVNLSPCQKHGVNGVNLNPQSKVINSSASLRYNESEISQYSRVLRIGSSGVDIYRNNVSFHSQWVRGPHVHV